MLYNKPIRLETQLLIRRETMKKAIIVLSLLALFFSACSVIERFTPEEPTPVPPTPMPTATPDPCAPENLMEEMEELVDLINIYQDIELIAGVTNQTDLTMPLLELQESRRNLQNYEVPVCLEPIKTASINYMIQNTLAYVSFMAARNDEERANAVQALENTQPLWQIVLGEVNKILSENDLIEETLPSIDSSDPSATDSGIFITNIEEQGVNVRSQPDLDASIIASFEPGMQAIGLGRDEAGDWVLINLDGIIGWVYAEMIEATEPIEDLPISDPVQ